MTWTFKSRSVPEFGYVLAEREFGEESAARDAFEDARSYAEEHGGAGSLHGPDGEQVGRFSVWCPND